MKLICFGVRDNEIRFFNNLNIYNYRLTFCPDNLSIENVLLCEGHEAIMVRGNCSLNKNVLKELKQLQVKYIMTRTVGLDHIDIQYANELEFKIAYVPKYSPNAISELVITLALNLLRNIPYTLQKTSNGDFTVDSIMFSREIRNCIVGIIGTGHIGTVTAKLFNGLGAKVIGYDIHQNTNFIQYGEYTTFQEVIEKSDILSLHVPYIMGVNHHLINKEIIKLMKQDSIIINTSRGQIVDLNSIIDAIQANKIGGFGADVLENEKLIFNKKFTDIQLNYTSSTLHELIQLYPRVLITPHIASYTDEALINMISVSYDNLYKFVNNIHCDNQVLIR